MGLHPCHSPSACVAVAVQGWTWPALKARRLSCACTALVAVRGRLTVCGGTCCLPACAAHITAYSSFLAEMGALLLLAEDCTLL